MPIRSLLSFAWLVVVLVFGSALSGHTALAQGSAAAPPGLTAAPAESTYLLGPGDRLRVTIYGEQELSGEFDIDGRGAISMPLIGEVQVGNMTARNAERTIAAKFADGYLRDPQVAVQITGYRPFYILGEVRAPGGFPFVNGMTIVTAVALAGGYTPRANRRSMTIIRGNDPQRREMPATEDTPVMPGDTVRITDRIF